MLRLRTKLIVGAASLAAALLVTIVLFETISSGAIMEKKEKPVLEGITTRQSEECLSYLMGGKVTFDLNPKHIERNEEWIIVAEELNRAQQAKKSISLLEADLKARLQGLSNDESSKGGDFIFTRFMSKGSVDYKAIPQLSGVDLDSYRKEGFARWKLTKI